MENRNAEMIKSLEELTQFLRDNPTIKFDHSFTIYNHCGTKEELLECAPMIGACEKGANCEWYNLTKRFGSRIRGQWYINRQKICERVVVGEKIIPAKEEIRVPEQVLPAEPERRELVYEWKCPDSLLRPSEDDAKQAKADDADVLQSANEAVLEAMGEAQVTIPQ